jgi:hypothetical protein
VRYGKWPHEVAALPFHYYLALREDWIADHTAAGAEEAEKLPGVADVVEFNAETFKGESV